MQGKTFDIVSFTDCPAMATPCATMEERVCFNAELADEYYDEEPKKKRPKKG